MSPLRHPLSLDLHPGVPIRRVPGTGRGSAPGKAQVQLLPTPSESSSKKLCLWKTEFPSINPNWSVGLSWFRALEPWRSMGLAAALCSVAAHGFGFAARLGREQLARLDFLFEKPTDQPTPPYAHASG